MTAPSSPIPQTRPASPAPGGTPRHRRAHHRLMRGKAEAVGVLGRFRDTDLNRRAVAVPGRVVDGIGERLRRVLEPPLQILELGDHAAGASLFPRSHLLNKRSIATLPCTRSAASACDSPIALGDSGSACAAPEKGRGPGSSPGRLFVYSSSPFAKRFCSSISFAFRSPAIAFA
jgi:hypothetical protein